MIITASEITQQVRDWRPFSGLRRKRSKALSDRDAPLALRYRACNATAGQRSDPTVRALNLFVACVGIALTAPLMVVIAVAIKVTSPGPVVFKQNRVGHNRRRAQCMEFPNQRRGSDRGGRLFTIYKFRTMRHLEGDSAQRWAAQQDPRITPVGRFLRATRLDELPQFFNVIKGDMNIVGPRPEQPDIFAELDDELGHRYRRRQRVLPGITGMAQVHLGYDTDLEGVRRKVDMDLAYIGERSAGKDLEIMAKTIPVMVFGKVWM
jgi:lipopolysaccharide/colanic/teichoic acid biosynthesis glycosyltransferase